MKHIIRLNNDNVKSLRKLHQQECKAGDPPCDATEIPCTTGCDLNEPMMPCGGSNYDGTDCSAREELNGQGYTWHGGH